MTPGTRVRFSKTFLTGRGKWLNHEASKTFVVEPCDCSLCRKNIGRQVAVDEPAHALMYADQHERRHIAVENLETVKQEVAA